MTPQTGTILVAILLIAGAGCLSPRTASDEPSFSPYFPTSFSGVVRGEEQVDLELGQSTRDVDLPNGQRGRVVSYTGTGDYWVHEGIPLGWEHKDSWIIYRAGYLGVVDAPWALLWGVDASTGQWSQFGATGMIEPQGQNFLIRVELSQPDFSAEVTLLLEAPFYGNLPTSVWMTGAAGDKEQLWALTHAEGTHTFGNGLQPWDGRVIPLASGDGRLPARHDGFGELSLREAIDAAAQEHQEVANLVASDGWILSEAVLGTDSILAGPGDPAFAASWHLHLASPDVSLSVPVSRTGPRELGDLGLQVGPLETKPGQSTHPVKGDSVSLAAFYESCSQAMGGDAAVDLHYRAPRLHLDWGGVPADPWGVIVCDNGVLPVHPLTAWRLWG